MTGMITNYDSYAYDSYDSYECLWLNTDFIFDAGTWSFLVLWTMKCHWLSIYSHVLDMNHSN